MLIPLAIDSESEWPARQRHAYAVLALVAACLAIQIVLSRLPAERQLALIYRLGVVKYDFQWHSVVTCAFLHGGWLHLVGNMFYLWVYGGGLERRIGAGWFLAIYLVGGAAGVGIHLATLPPTLVDVPAIGASAAISAILGAFFVILPKARLKCAMILSFRPLLASLPAWILLGMWFVGQLYFSVDAVAGGNEVAFWAHVGGFAVGAVLGSLLALAWGREESPWRPPLILAWRHFLAGDQAAARQAWQQAAELGGAEAREPASLLANWLAEGPDGGEATTAALDDQVRRFRRLAERLEMAAATTCYVELARRFGEGALPGDVHRLAGEAALASNQPTLGLRAYCLALRAGLPEAETAELRRRVVAVVRHKLGDETTAARLEAAG